MATVKIAEKKIWVDDTPIPLLSGEVHYWRLGPANWLPILQRARDGIAGYCHLCVLGLP